MAKGPACHIVSKIYIIYTTLSNTGACSHLYNLRRLAAFTFTKIYKYEKQQKNVAFARCIFDLPEFYGQRAIVSNKKSHCGKQRQLF
jgi:hypothetical protein